MGQRVAQRADGVQQRRSKGVLNGSWTHSVHQLSRASWKASAQAVWASVLGSVQMVCSSVVLHWSSNKFEMMAPPVRVSASLDRISRPGKQSDKIGTHTLPRRSSPSTVLTRTQAMLTTRERRREDLLVQTVLAVHASAGRHQSGRSRPLRLYPESVITSERVDRPQFVQGKDRNC